mgnify:CR=1 FL=1
MPTQTSSPIDPMLDPQVAQAIVEHAAEGIVITDAAGNILQVNAAYCHMTGYSADEVIGKNPRLVQSGRHDPAFYEAMWNALLTEGRWSGKIWNRRKDGSIFLESLTVVTLRNAEGEPTRYVGLLTDVTYGGLDETQISQLAFYDPLTGLATRPLLIDHMGEAIRHCKRKGCHVALLYLNLDDFGEINKAHGHAAGDALLKAYAEQLEASVRQNDTVARPGGDEFALILGEVGSPDDIPRVAEKLLHRLSEPVDHEGRGVALRASIGVSIYPGHGQDAEQLVTLAREAMTKAKAAGKNRWVMHERPGDPDAQPQP